ncbi:hypothetical protein [Mycobacterium sp. 852002-51613_SCH5001154]|uniref:hypothetical protein n=1 Tax=Mycobacterium sp. 852002-51613_SCH5001154 TaxID=1834104 RepID=UPI000B16E8AB|nr:hypothetical protein [Mycobacterium sp. 852002-51613_SCH5001154]
MAACRRLSQGFEPTAFEQGPTLGGQSAPSDECTGCPGRYTNSSRILTAFSHLDDDSDIVYQPNRGVLHRHAAPRIT